MSNRWIIILLFFCVLGFFWLNQTASKDNIAQPAAAAMFGEFASLLDTTTVDEAMVFVGDIMLGRDVATQMSQAGSDWPFLTSYDLLAAKATVGNFEAAIPVVYKQTPDFNMTLFANTADLAGLVGSGITHLSLANNHTFDADQQGYENTLKQLQLRGFGVAGHPTIVSSSSVSYVELGAMTVSILNLNATYNYPEADEWMTMVSDMVRDSELQIVYVHWGDEYELVHNAAQEQLAHDLVDAGIDMIVGTHPHVVQDIERYKNSLIFYSLGNFIFDQYFSEAVQQGLTLRLKEGDDGWTVQLIPIESMTAAAQPREMDTEMLEIFLSALAERSQTTLMEEIRSGSLGLQF